MSKPAPSATPATPATPATNDRRGKYARSEETRARILEAALTESAQVGFFKASMAKIALRAEVAVGVLNYHFGSREEMLRELMMSQVQDFLSRVTVPDATTGFFEYEASVLGTYLEFLHDNPCYVRLGEEIRLHDPALYRQGIINHIGHIVVRIRSGIEAGDLPAMDESEIRTRAYFMLGAYTFLDRMIEDDQYPGDRAVTTQFMTMLQSGFNRPQA